MSTAKSVSKNKNSSILDSEEIAKLEEYRKLCQPAESRFIKLKDKDSINAVFMLTTLHYTTLLHYSTRYGTRTATRHIPTVRIKAHEEQQDDNDWPTEDDIKAYEVARRQ
jgi:hypothetical protein